MIIGLSGYARSGKDEVAKILVQEYGYERVAFADPIRRMLYELNPVIVESNLLDSVTLQELVDSQGWDEAKKDPEVRLMLQNLGVSARKIISEDVWVETALRYVVEGSKVVITDVRFPNEAARIKLYGGQIWRVTRPNVVPVNGHISEHALDNWDFDKHISNTADLEFLKEQVAKALT